MKIERVPKWPSSSRGPTKYAAVYEAISSLRATTEVLKISCDDPFQARRLGSSLTGNRKGLISVRILNTEVYIRLKESRA